MYHGRWKRRPSRWRVAMIEFFTTTLRLARGVASAWRRDPQFRSLVVLVLITLLGGTIFYGSVEGWSVVDAFYFSVTTLTTVGLGGLAPTMTVGKLFHGGLHLRGSEHNLGLYRDRGEGDPEAPE